MLPASRITCIAASKNMNRIVRTTALWMGLMLAPTWLWAAPPLAVATIVDGEATLVREASRHRLAEGVRLGKDDIVETSPKSRLIRVEFSDGVILDLGPQSRVLLAPKLAGERSKLPTRAHLLRGVAKLTVPQPLPPSAATFSSPAFDVTGVARSAVFVVQADQANAFAESGQVTLQERHGGKAGAATPLKSGEFYSRAGEAKATLAPRPSPAFIQQLPRPFLDTLPSRAGLFKAREVEPKPLGDITFGEAEAWIDAEGLRSQFAARWKALAQNPEFRTAVAANLRAHPEWDRVLYPEKYLPKATGAPASAAAVRY
jgi:hypothetical protein